MKKGERKKVNVVGNGEGYISMPVLFEN